MVFGTSGLNDFNNLREEETGDMEDPYCQDEVDNDPHFQEEIALIERDLEEMEIKIREISEHCGVPCSSTTRLPCVAHKVRV